MHEGLPHIEGFTSNGWTGIVVMLVVMGYLFALGMSGRQYVRRLTSLGKQRHRMVNYTDEVMDWRADVVLAVTVVLSVALCAYAYLVRGGLVQFGFTVFAVSAGVTVSVFALKIGLAKIVSYVFGVNVDVAILKVTAVYVVFGFIAFLLSMVVGVVAEMNVTYILGMVLLAGAVIGEFVILVENFFAKTLSLFYIFLYLCAAEILPLLVGFRIVNIVLN